MTNLLPTKIHNSEKLNKGVKKYTFLRRRLYEADVSTDAEFQRIFNGFFRMRQRSPAFYKDFYIWMEEHKTTGVDFHDTLSYFYNLHHRLEISFSSKLVALIDPSKPIWDSVVTLGHFGIKAPYAASKNRLQIAIDRYCEYCARYAAFMQTPSGKELISEFNTLFPNSEISDVKKLDFMLWVSRDN